MKICHSLMFFFFLGTLRGGSACLGDGGYIPEFTRSVGGTLTLICHLSFPEKMKLFCKGDCKDGVVLVATAGVEAQSGRFRMEYKSMPQASMTPVSVSITNLTKSDSGKYSCTSEGTLAAAETQTFVVKVVDAQTAPQPKFTTTRPPTLETTPMPTSSASEPKKLPNTTGLLRLLLTPTPTASILETPSADESNRVPEGDREDDNKDTSPSVIIT